MLIKLKNVIIPIISTSIHQHQRHLRPTQSSLVHQRFCEHVIIHWEQIHTRLYKPTITAQCPSDYSRVNACIPTNFSLKLKIQNKLSTSSQYLKNISRISFPNNRRRQYRVQIFDKISDRSFSNLIASKKHIGAISQQFHCPFAVQENS